MNLVKKLAIGTLAVAALVSTPMAEQIAIAGQVAPLASLVPIGGNTNLQWSNIIKLAAAVTDASPVAKFFVTTNMPKWNVYITFANGGRLLNASGKGMELAAALPSTVVPAFVTLKFGSAINATDDAATPLYVGTDASTVGKEVKLAEATLDQMQSFTSALNTGTHCVPAGIPGVESVACTFTNWLNGTDINSTGVDVGMVWLPGVAQKPKLAGTYSEIIYITLATSY